MVYTILNSLGSVSNSLRRFYQFPIQVCPLCIGIIRHICFTLCILSLYVARHTAVTATATLEVAYCIIEYYSF